MLANKLPIAQLALRKVLDADTVAVDVETSGLDAFHQHIVGWVLTIGPAPDDSFYIPVRHAGGGNLPSGSQVPSMATNWDGSIHPIEIEIIKALYGKELVFHNAAFDMRFMHRLGWSPSGPIRDTMIGAYLTDELRPSLSLEAVCREEKVQEKRGTDLYKAISARVGCAPDRNSMGFLWQMPGDDDQVVDYSCGDGTSTWQLWESLKVSISKPYYVSANREYSLEAVARVEFDLIPVLHKMSMRGVKIDEERLGSLTKEILEEFDQSLAMIGEMNVRSPLQVKDYFIKHGITNWPKTEKGAASFPESWLKTTKEGQAIVRVRKNRTLLDSFLIPMSGRFMHNGRVHTEFHQTRDEEFGTRTGRLSTTSPNMGAMPGKRQGELGRRFREIFIPDDGMEFTEADYNVCEIRICAHYCQAKAWLDGFKAGKDPHTAISDALGIPRRHAKTINLALMTGAGKTKIASELGIPLQEGLAVVEQYFDGLPELKEFQRQATRAFESRGFISTLLGRRLQLAKPDKAYTAVNRLTQGGNADIIKSAMVALDKVPNIETMLTVYDSTLFQHAKGDTKARNDALDTIVNMKELGIDFSVPMRAEYGSGASWGEATFNEEGWLEK
ncbi:MAG: hypothetical protein EHM33_00520 [Chloroflexi bacterium]|nr:MAG: hypothetical protein EHM33_00520 [Chloroflexota bacterium]